MSCDRRLVLLGLLGLGACGFEPAVAPGGAVAGLHGRIAPSDPTTRLEFLFVTRLRDRLGPPGPDALILTHRITTTTEGKAITPDNQTLRYDLLGRLDYRLGDPAGGPNGGDLRASGQITAVTAYSAIGDLVATRASEVDAQGRLAVMLADRLVTRLMVTAADWQW